MCLLSVISVKDKLGFQSSNHDLKKVTNFCDVPIESFPKARQMLSRTIKIKDLIKDLIVDRKVNLTKDNWRITSWPVSYRARLASRRQISFIKEKTSLKRVPQTVMKSSIDIVTPGRSMVFQQNGGLVLISHLVQTGFLLGLLTDQI